MTSGPEDPWARGTLPFVDPDSLGRLIAAASDLALLIDDGGLIRTVLALPDGLPPLVDRNIRDILLEDSLPKLERSLSQSAMGDGERAIEINLDAPGETWGVPFRARILRMGDDGAHLLLGRDLRPVAESQQRLVETQAALEAQYERDRAAEVRYRTLLRESHDAILFVDPATQAISDATPAAEALFGVDAGGLAGATLAQQVLPEEAAAVRGVLAEETPPVRLTARRTGRALDLTAVGPRSAVDRAVLCRLTPATDRPEAGAAIAGDAATVLSRLADGVAFVDGRGRILWANAALRGLTAGDRPLEGTPLADILARGGIDQRTILEHARSRARLRRYATRVVAAVGEEVPVELAAIRLTETAAGDGAAAYALILRETREARPGGDARRPEDMREVADLVGSASLKEIVAETTDVIERICIEAAVELTQNNRVAAAEMLGLSRQSLYVKLRKYGLTSRTAD